MVQVRYGEGVASHIDPESCACGREAAGEALTGECIGQAIEPRKTMFRGADVVPSSGRQDGPGASSRDPAGPAWSQNLACAEAFLHGNREISDRQSATQSCVGSASGRRGAVADDARSVRSQTPP